MNMFFYFPQVLINDGNCVLIWHYRTIYSDAPGVASQNNVSFFQEYEAPVSGLNNGLCRYRDD
jgi:hypothetical protein